MACRFEEETDCCAVCGAAFHAYAAAGGRCRDLGAGVVHLDRARAQRHARELAPLIAELAADARNIARVPPPNAAALVWDPYDPDDGTT